MNQLGIANRDERIQALESVLELPRSVGITSASRGTTSCRPARWPRFGSTSNCCARAGHAGAAYAGSRAMKTSVRGGFR